MAGGRDDGAITEALIAMEQVLAQTNEQAAVGHRDPGEAEERTLNRFLRNSPSTFKVDMTWIELRHGCKPWRGSFVLW
jgi:hypothetical protein